MQRCVVSLDCLWFFFCEKHTIGCSPKGSLIGTQFVIFRLVDPPNARACHQHGLHRSRRRLAEALLCRKIFVVQYCAPWTK